MEKKQYIQPMVVTFGVDASSMICGSGDDTGDIPAGGGGSSSDEKPQGQKGTIIGDAKSSNFDPDFEFDDDFGDDFGNHFTFY